MKISVSFAVSTLVSFERSTPPMWNNHSCCNHVWTLGSCQTKLLYPQRQLPKPLGSFPTANLSSICLHLPPTGWVVAQCHFRHHLACVWVSKKHQKAAMAELPSKKIPTGHQKAKSTDVVIRYYVAMSNIPTLPKKRSEWALSMHICLFHSNK